MSEPPQKRFRYATYTEKLGAISVDVGRNKGMTWEKEDFADEEQNKTPFTVELARLELQDLTLGYTAVSKAVYPLTRTLPMTLLNLPTIFETFGNFFSSLKEGRDHVDSGLNSVLFLLQALFETCLGEAVAYVPETAGNLVRTGALRALEPKLVERTYSTLSLLLRTISPTLLKSEHEAKLRAAWNEVRPYLGTNNKAYVRKCIADAWSGVIRKARGDALAHLMSVLNEEHTPGMETVWTSAMKGTTHHLHSRAVPVFTVLLNELAGNPTDDAVATVRRVVTALVHHCSSSNTAPLVEVVLQRVAPEPAASSSKNKTALRFDISTAMLDVLAAFLFTRKGKRFPSAQLKPAMSKLQALIPEVEAASGEDANTWRRAIVSAVVGTLTAGHLAEWLSPGVALIEALWNALSTPEAFAFANMCIALKWAGVEQFLLAHISRAALTGLKDDPLPTFVLLNNLAAAGFLTGGLSNVQGGRWRAALVKALGERLALIREGPLYTSDLRLLGQVLTLVPNLSGEGAHFAPHLLAILDRVTSSKGKGAHGPKDADAARDEYRTAGPWNNSHTVGRILATLFQLALRGPTATQDEIKNHFVNNDLLDAIIKNWFWNREVLEHAAAFVEHWSDTVKLECTNTDLLLGNLISADSSLRLSSLKILAVASRESSPTCSAIWDLCMVVERSEMSLKNVRERTNHIARLGRYLVGQAEATGDVVKTVDMAITYLVAQLKVNFRPVWAEAVTQLTALVPTHGERIWTVVWDELQKTIVANKAIVPDLEVTNPEWTAQKAQVETEEDDDEHEFRCTALAKGRATVTRSWAENNDTAKLDVAEIPIQRSSDRLDVLSYETQLLAVLTATPSLAEKHTRVVVPVVLAIAGTESDATVAVEHLSTRQLQTRTITFLELLAKFVNPKAAFRSAELHTLYLTLLSKGEPKVQGVALKCLLTYKSPNLTPYSERLSNLLDDSKFRDELANLDLGTESEVLEPPHRPEFLDVAIRLLYGIMMSRRARSSTAQGQGARKQAVLTALSGASSEELKTLADLMLEPFDGLDDNIDPAALDAIHLTAPGRQQLGFLTFLADVLKYLGPQTTPYWTRIFGATLVLVRQAQEGIDAEKNDAADEEEEVEEGDDDNDKGAAPLRSIRTIGLKRIVQFLRSNVIDYDFTPFLPALFKGIISPRLARLEIENTQAPSGTLDVIAALAASPETASTLGSFDERTLPKTFACMTAAKVKPAVISRVFDVIDSLLDEEETVQKVLLPHIRPLLDNIIELVASLRASANEDIMRRLLGILSRLSSVVTDGMQAQQLAGLLGPMLRQPGRQVSEKAKVNILVTLQRLYSISPDFKDPSSKFFGQSYDMISNLFQSLYLPTSRRALVAALQTFGESDASVVESIATVADLNAYRVKRMDEPDFDRRLDAFARLNDAEDADLPTTARQWLPIIRSALFFIQEPEELAIRTSAGTLLRRFISLASGDEGPLVDTVLVVILPSLRRILLSKIELVRNEVLLVLSHAVKTSALPVLSEMRPLLGEDDETNIFVNIAHIQVHRRARAVRRLRDIVSDEQVNIRETTLATIWLPVLEHILSGATDVTDHHFINEAVTSIGSLSGQLAWGRYNALLMRFIRLGKPITKQQKFYIRCVSSIIDNFHFDLKSDARVGEPVNDEAEVDSDKTLADSDATLADPETLIAQSAIAEQPVNPTERITEVVLTRLLPTLESFVSQKSETEDTVRIPVALGVVKLASQLPAESSENEILRVITTVSQILRSKDQDTRDIARGTIGNIAVFLGPTWLVRVLRELRTALQRGPQKHVLAVTAHSIMVQATTEAGDRFADLDQAVTDAVEIAAEVIWGESGKDTSADGFKTKMREVRGAANRGNDTFQLVSRLVSPSKISAVLAPVREIMHVSQAVKTMLQVDEVLRRIALGLNANSMIAPQDILNLCFSLINGNSRYLKPKKKELKQAKNNTDRFTVQMKRKADNDEDMYPQNAYKFVIFGLELFVTAFRRGKFDFDDVDILARLGPLVNAIGNTLYSPKADILVLGLKATAAVARCPVPQVDSALPAFVTNIFKIIKNAGGTAESEVAQTALKTLAVLIRDCKATEVSDSQLKYLIEVVSPDLEDHERQSSIFTVLRAVVARKFVVPEIYDLMDRVSSIMVTSQSTHVQELCRGVLMQFLLDYPQGAGRLKAQMTFLARNLDYVFESGRVSVMEVLSAVFNKFSGELLAEYADLFFVALVAVVANDESEKCRNMAGALLQRLFVTVDEVHQARMLGVLKGWVGGDDDTLAGAALSVFGLLCEAEDAPEDLFDQVPGVIGPVLRASASALSKAEAEGDDDAVWSLDHSRPQAALAVAAKAMAAPGVSDKLRWSDVVTLLLFPHQWVRFGAARALAVLFATRPAGGEQRDAISILGQDLLLDTARKSCILLGGSKGAEGEDVVVDAKLADQLVKLLWNISKHWAASDKSTDEELKAKAEAEDDSVGQEEDPNARPLAWLMSRMSFLARRLIIHRPNANDTLPGQPLEWTGPVMSILRFFAGAFEAMAPKQSRHFLVHILSPIYRILDENGDLAGLDGAGGIDDLRELATEVRDHVQNKVGTTTFSKSWERLRRKVSEKRAERRETRARLAVADPKAWAIRQEKRSVNKKESKKRKVNAYMDQKGKRRKQA